MPTPHLDLAVAEMVRKKLQEARDIADDYSKPELRTHLDTIIDYVNADITALRVIVGPRNNT
jgi:hypothetical protein